MPTVYTDQMYRAACEELEISEQLNDLQRQRIEALEGEIGRLTRGEPGRPRYRLFAIRVTGAVGWILVAALLVWMRGEPWVK